MATGQAAAAARIFLLAALVVAGAPPLPAAMATAHTHQLPEGRAASRSPSPLLSWNKDPKAKSFLEAFSRIHRCVDDIDALYAVMRSSAKYVRMKELSEGSRIGRKCCGAVRAAYWRSGVFGRLLPPVPSDEQPMYYVIFLCFHRYK